jgi:tetratricopeptide (TPR) repeat protein
MSGLILRDPKRSVSSGNEESRPNMGRYAVVNRAPIVLAASVFVFTALNGHAQDAAQSKASSPRAQLNQYMSDLKNSPDDFELRANIIKVVQKIQPKPSIPIEARHPFVKAQTFFKEAKGSSDYDLASASFKEALLLAPWWPEAYYNLSTAQEAAGRFDDAAQSLRLYLLTKPKDAEEAGLRLDSLEAKKELGARRASAVADAKRAELNSPAGEWGQANSGGNVYRITNSNGDWQVTNLNKLKGDWATVPNCRAAQPTSVEVSGRHVHFRENCSMVMECATDEVRSKGYTPSLCYWDWSVDLSEDGQQLTGRCTSQQGDDQHFDQPCQVLVRRN